MSSRSKSNASLLVLITTALLFLFNFIPCSANCNVLYSDTKLPTGQQLSYANSALIMQTDCNFVLYTNGIPTWHTNTAHRASNCFAQLDSYGELTVSGYNLIRSSLITVWRSRVKSVKGQYALVLNYDATFSVYGPSIWAAPAGGPILPTSEPAAEHNILPPPPVVDSTLWSGDVAPIGVTIVNNEYKLELLTNCNLTLSNTNTGKVLWASNSYDWLQDCYVTLGKDGELGVKYLGGAPLWGTNVTGPYSTYVLALRQDGKIVTYGPPIWFNGKAKTGEIIAMVTDQDQ